MRYRIEVRAQRGDQDPYSYVAHHKVKPGKAQRLVDQTAIAVARHERSSYAVSGSFLRFDWYEDSPEDVSPVSVYVGACTFHVYAVALL